MESNPLRLISWNVAGRVKLQAAQLEVLRVREPSIVALQEVTKQTLPFWLHRLPDLGLPHLADSLSSAPDPLVLTRARRYGQLIASHWPLRMIAKQFTIPWPETALSRMVVTPSQEFEIHNVHIPPGASHGWLKIETLEAIYDALATHSQEPRVLCGDFNTPQEETLEGRIVTWAERRNKKGELFLRRGRGERWDQAERGILDGLRNFELVDAFRDLNGYQVQPYSWYARCRGQRVGRRFDHVFASTALSALRCVYMEEVIDAGLSDHAAVEVDFGIEVCLGSL